MSERPVSPDAVTDLLRKFIQHVNEIHRTEHILTTRVTSVSFTAEERAMLLKLEAEGFQHRRRAPQ